MEKLKKDSNASLIKYIADGTCQAIVDRYLSLQEQAHKLDFGELDEDIIVLDTETTGFSLNHDELIQIAAARMKKGTITEWFVTFVNPQRPIPEEIVHLTDIADSDVADAPTAEEAVSNLVAFVGDSDVLAHNAEFDLNFVTKYSAGTPLRNNTWIDSLDLARIALPRLKSHRLLDLVRAFDAPISTHRADADVEALCSIYRILLAGIAAMPIPLVKKITEMATDEEWPTIKVFKKTLVNYARLEGGKTPASGFENKHAKPSQEESPSAKAASRTDKVETAQTEFDFESGATVLPFSLKTLRRERISELVAKPKPDADALASDLTKSLLFPSEDEILADFSKDGLVGSLYDRYEARTEQVSMASSISRAFASSTNLAVEAGTGVGKSMAYLVPAARTAQKNNIGIGVATKTNALLDQLMYKELPLLAQTLKKQHEKELAEKSKANQSTQCSAKSGTENISGESGSNNSTDDNKESVDGAGTTLPEESSDFVPLSYVALKGFSHYPCLRMINRLVQDMPKNKMVAGKLMTQAPPLASLLSFIEQSEYDDIGTLKIDYRALPRYTITTTSHECLRRKCPFFGVQCFVHGARRRAESADIVVTNHSLLFCDLAADGGLLPNIRYWVLDEAHGAENEARRAFSLEISADKVNNLVRKVASDEASQNAFIRAERRAGAALDDGTLFYALTTKARAAGKNFSVASEEFLRHIKDLSFFDTNKGGKGYDFVELWLNDDIRGSETFRTLASYGKILCDHTEKLIAASQDVVAILESVDEAAEVQREIATVTLNLKELLNSLETILFKSSPAYAYSATISRKKDRVSEKLEALLVNVGDKLNETLFEQTHSVIFTSATLTVADSFDSFETALGLNESEHSKTATTLLDSSYDFDNNMTVYVVDDIPEPNDPGYLPALQRLLIMLLRAQHGSMLTLFTNRKEMEKCYDVVQPALKEDDLRVVCQKWGISAKGLRDDFLSDEHLSLFALKSFWEGFDAPGSTLKGVVIPRLPFSKPSDPLSCERALRDSKAWSNFVLPAAVLETKQAAGRLIRKADDTGCLILADRRLITKGYGKVFLRSMPSKTVKICSSAAISEELTTRRLQKPEIQ